MNADWPRVRAKSESPRGRGVNSRAGRPFSLDEQAIVRRIVSTALVSTPSREARPEPPVHRRTRGRNVGLVRLAEEGLPEFVQFIQFIDGDC